MAHWGDRVDEVMIRISGSHTDWLNQWCIVSHTRVKSDSPNADIFAAKALVNLYALYPAKFNKNKNALLSNWRNGEHVSQTRVAALLRSAVAKTGKGPTAYSLHSLRAVGPTALYRATKDIDIVARFGRWGGSLDFRFSVGNPSDDGGAKRPHGYGRAHYPYRDARIETRQ